MTEAVKKVPIPAKGVDYRGKVVLAPMVRSGELPSRLLALKYGADLVWGPETIDRAIIGTTRTVNEQTGCVEWCRIQSHGLKEPPPDAKTSVIYATDPVKEANRLVFQMGTADPDLAVQAARLVAGDVAGIDVNAGCPKPFSTSGGMGAALLRTPDKLIAILEALVRDITPHYDIGISVKIRILETAAETEALVRRLVATGITGLTVHCRTTPMRPRERAIRGQLRMVADVCREAGVACLMNGDVESKDEGLRLAAEFGADGAMIATAAETNPSCFRAAADGGLLPWREVVDEYVATAMAVNNKFGNTKYLLAQMVPGKESAHKAITRARSYVDVCEGLALPHLLERARVLDDLRGLGQPTEKQKLQAARKAAQSTNASALAAGGQMGHARALSKNKKSLSDRQQPPPSSESDKTPVASAA
ncbi:tRNA dihydrouridine synthase [Cordyceps fumosorosea ARSEF 2679]|uniref:tRNA dihydrouridine synthase n=1 Tax=Cordyceps fumosorosea (strain ARSEF 2679) TaxID=1081104 RepID=A0A167ZHM0_CORFA|nr:tRNA dihydrouridine synthase [Cordyceps fumosorosea ARSEF 2679]OAA67528.1 tRNA dihydrouridine synthase [Cordyceps fumosorosea ARSEF 2679]